MKSFRFGQIYVIIIIYFLFMVGFTGEILQARTLSASGSELGHIWFTRASIAAALIILIFVIFKEKIMQLGIFERIRERRRLAAAAAVANQYDGVNLFETKEAQEIPTAKYTCGNDACVGYRYSEADNMYWVDSPPLPPGWYCARCTEGMRDKDKSSRLNLSVFFTVLDYEASQLDKK